CALPIYKGSLRVRSARSFVDEIEFLRDSYQYNAFDFWDDTMTMLRPHIENICEEILARDIKIKWYCRARVNTVDKNLLKLMKQSGCIAISYGVESGSNRMLAAINKGITRVQSEEAIRISSELGLMVTAFFILSLPGENISDIDATLDLMKKFRKYHNVRCFYCFSIIYPGTDLEKMAIKEDLLPTDFSWHKPYTFVKNKIVGNDPTLPCYENPYLKIEEIKAHVLKSDSPGLNFKKAVRKISRIRHIADIKDIASFFAKYFLRNRTGKNDF
ncbi:MAG: radical SAM protein, partial [Candidatus Omnitrophica bacterium]|nr:radical SAM protein [Candidatus Omnitrophota bacterium]